MAEEKVEIVLDGKDAGIVRAWMATRASIEATEAALGKLDPAQKKNAESARQFQRDVKAALDSTRSPLEQYEAKLQRLNELYTAQGGISSEVYNRRKAQLQAELAQADGSAAAKANAERQLAESLNRQEKLEQQHAARSLAAQKRVFQEGQQLTEQTATAQERHNAKLAHYRQLLDQSAISKQTFNRLEKQSVQDLNASGTALGGIGGKLTALIGGYASLTAGVNFFRQANEEAMRVAAEAATKQDDVVRRFRAQAGLTELEGDAAKGDIYAAGEAAAMTPDQAFGAATSLVSTGFEAKEAQGAALTPFLKLIAAQALDPKKATGTADMAENFSQFLSATGQDKTGANVEKLAVAIQSVKATPLKVTDLAQLSKQGAGLKEMGRLSPEDMLANFANLRNVLSAEDAGTGMREVVKNLAIAGSRKDRVKELKKMGLKAEDVDFVGEDLQTVLQRVQKGLQKLPEKDRAGALDKLVEGANIATFNLMAKGQADVEKLRSGMDDKAGFEADVEVGTSGRNAAARRQASRQQRKKAEKNNNRDLYGAALEEFEQDRGTSDVQTAFRRTAYNTMTGLGFSPETSTKWVSGSDFGGDNQADQQKILGQVSADLKGFGGAAEDQKALREETRALLEATKANTAAVLAASGKTQVEVKVNGVAAPSKVSAPAPRPAAALSFDGGSQFGGGTF